MLGNNLFTAAQIVQQEKELLNFLKWSLRPVTPYEIMRHFVLFAKLNDECLEDKLIYHAQVVVDFALCGKECKLHVSGC